MTWQVPDWGNVCYYLVLKYFNHFWDIFKTHESVTHNLLISFTLVNENQNKRNIFTTYFYPYKKKAYGNSQTLPSPNPEPLLPVSPPAPPSGEATWWRRVVRHYSRWKWCPSVCYADLTQPSLWELVWRGEEPTCSLSACYSRGAVMDLLLIGWSDACLGDGAKHLKLAVKAFGKLWEDALASSL